MADTELTARLAEIAERLEVLAGIDPSTEVRRDTTLTSRLKRIADAIQGGGIEKTSHGLLTGLSADDHPHYLLADGTRDLTGTLTVTETVDDRLSRGWDGSIIETTSVTVTSDGTTILLNLSSTEGNTLTTRFDGISIEHDITVPDTVELLEGTDAAPIQTFVWLQISGDDTVLTAGTEWPSVAYAAVATVICQSAASLQTDGAYKVQVWTDHVHSVDGHMSHISRKMRRQAATWDEGVAPGAMVVDNPDAYLSVGSGFVYQLHRHTFPALDMQTGDPIYLVNDPTTAYKRITTLDDITQDASGNSINLKYLSLVLWGSVNQESGDCKLFLNLPTDVYSTSASAILDADKTAVFDIPANFTGTGFLIARYVVQAQNSGAWVQAQLDDLRGQMPTQNVAGGGAGVSAFDDLSDVSAAGPASDAQVFFDGSRWVDGKIKPQWLNVTLLGGQPLGTKTFFLNTVIASGDSYKWIETIPVLTSDIFGDISGTPINNQALISNGTGIWAPQLVILADGSVELIANWDAGAFEITADKWIAQCIVQGSCTTADFGHDITTTGNDLSTFYTGLLIDQDYSTAHISNAVIYGLHIEQDIGGAGTLVGSYAAIAADVAHNGETRPGLNPGINGLVVGIKGNTTSKIWGAFTKGINNHATGGIAYGYQGFGQNTSTGPTASAGLRAVGVYGFASTTGAGFEVGVQGEPFHKNTAGFAFYTPAGHNHYSAGITYFYINTGIQLAQSTTHLTPNTDNGSVWIEDQLEVDGIAHFDGDIDHNGTNWGMFGTAPTTQQTVTGSRGGNAALASLLTALANYGVIVDSSTA